MPDKYTFHSNYSLVKAKVFLFLLLSSLLLTACGTTANRAVSTSCKLESDWMFPNDVEREASKKKLNQLNSMYGRVEPIFGLRTPLLFAHRGGSYECPESTMQAFRHAKDKAYVDVLELDVQLTKDGKFVVWHGPDLDNVVIDGVESDLQVRKEKKRRNIDDFAWCELDGKALVNMPDTNMCREDGENKESRQLLLLKDFLQREEFFTTPLNIEMKETFLKKLGDRDGLDSNIKEFIKILNLYGGDRKIVVASVSHKMLKAFRRLEREGKFATNLSWLEILKLRFSSPNLENRALETTYCKLFSSKGLIKKVKDQKGATFIFITKFGPVRALDKSPLEDEISEILSRGVDGIITDQPICLRKIIDSWIFEKVKNKGK